MDELPDDATPPEWIEALEQNEAEFAIGNTVPSSSVRELFRATIAELETVLAGHVDTEATPSR